MTLRRRLDLLAVTGLLAVQAVVQLLVRPNPRWNDGIYMLNYARHFPDVPANHFTLRLGLLLPTRLAEAVFGYGQVAYYAYPFLCSLLLVAATYFVGRELFGRWAGAIAALLLAVNPLLTETVNLVGGVEHMTSWQLLPDIPSTAFFTLGLALLLIGLRRGGSDRRPGWGWLVTAGVCFGWAYLIRETIPFLYPVIALALALWRARLRSWLWVAGTMLAVLAVECMVNAGLYGSPLARLHTGAEQGGAPLIHLTRSTATGFFVRVIREYPATAAWLVAIGVTALAPLLVRRREHLVPAVWGGVYWIAMLGLSGVVNPKHIIVQGQLPRYWIPMLPALALGFAGGLAGLWSRLRLRVPIRMASLTPALAAAAVLAAFAAPVAPNIADNPRDSAWHSVRDFLHAHDSEVDRLAVDDRDALTLDVYRLSATGDRQLWHGQAVVVPHFLGHAPAPTVASWLLWTGQLSKYPPTADSGWQPVLVRPGLGIYRSAAG